MPMVELTDVRCYYELLGSGEPVLLIPGLGRTHEVWEQVARELSPDFSLILVDKRDVGQSRASARRWDCRITRSI